MISTAGIDGNRPLGRLRRAAGRSAAGGGEFARHIEGETAAATGGTCELGGIAGLDTLLGIQEVGDDEHERRRSTHQYGEALLDRLEALRRELLAGIVPLDRLTALAQTLRGRQRRSGNEDLDAVIADIELRVEVEIAKLHDPR
jgi:hypothetical protein